jgi:hypothetical protein
MEAAEIWRSPTRGSRGRDTFAVGRSEGPFCSRVRENNDIEQYSCADNIRDVAPASYLGASSAMRSFAAFATASPALISKALMATITPMLCAGAKAT